MSAATTRHASAPWPEPSTKGETDWMANIAFWPAVVAAILIMDVLEPAWRASR